MTTVTLIGWDELKQLRSEVATLRYERDQARLHCARDRCRAERLTAALREIAGTGGAAGEVAKRALVEAATV